jgi:tetratricopeptide (TPR) repeat protein
MGRAAWDRFALTDTFEDSIDSPMSNRPLLAWKVAGLSFLLVALVWLVFGQTLLHRFVNFDDGAYVYRNSEVMRGITIQGTKWAFTHFVAANWHPLTVLSHMLDCQLYGVTPAGHHFTNVLLHSIAVILLFVAFWWMTHALWRSAFVAAVFAIHPLHVESVAWIAERKDVLSAVFFMLTIIAYVHYTHRPSIPRYALMSILFACGLMAKPMLVTLPFVLLLLDYWPLGRFDEPKRDVSKSRDTRRNSQLSRLLFEKTPLLILSAGATVATLFAQERSISVVRELPSTARIANAFVSLMVYLGQTVWPMNLAVFYPHRANNIPILELAVAVLLFTAVTAAAFILREQKPYFLVGWLWFVGMLLPVIGLIQVGLQAHADRYTYLPQIGVCVLLAWTIADLSARRRHRRAVLTIAALATLAPLTWLARVQASHWTDSGSLWEHAVAVTSNNENAREHLSDAYLENGRIDDAIAQAREAISDHPDSADAHGVLGAALTRKGKLDEALSELQAALQLNPKLTQAHFNLANILLQRGQVDEAITAYEAELRIQPKSPEAHNNLANAFFRKHQPGAALEHLKIALELNPNYAEARNNLAIAFSQMGQMRDAIVQWNKTLEIEPNNLDAQCNLVWIFATFPDASIRDGSRAVELGQRAIRLSGGKNAKIWRLAAAAYAEAGRFPEAIKAAQSGLALAEAEGNSALAQTLEENLKLFEQNSPLRDVSAAATPGSR